MRTKTAKNAHDMSATQTFTIKKSRPNKKARNITLTDSVFIAARKHAFSQGMSLSGMIEQLLRERLAKKA